MQEFLHKTLLFGITSQSLREQGKPSPNFRLVNALFDGSLGGDARLGRLSRLLTFSTNFTGDSRQTEIHCAHPRRSGKTCFPLK